MSSMPELERFGPGSSDLLLVPQQIRKLRDELIWPAAEVLWGGDFWESSVPGEIRYHTSCRTTAEGPRIAVVQMSCEINDDYSPGAFKGDDKNDEYAILRSIYIKYGVARDDLSYQFVEAAKRDAKAFDDDYELRRLERVGKYFTAWQSHGFSFDTQPFFRLVEVERCFELRDPDTDLVWDDKIMPAVVTSDGEDGEAEEPGSVMVEVDMLEEKTELEPFRLRRSDRLQIIQALALLGVVEEASRYRGYWQWPKGKAK